MEIIFLGTGTSQGVPMIAHDHADCDLNHPKNWRSRSSIHVEMGGIHIQVDAAPEFRLQCILNDITWIDTFILTHGHADHIVGMDDLRRFCDLRDGHALPVYSTAGGLQRVEAMFPYAIHPLPVRRGYPAFAPAIMPASLETPGGTIHSVLLPHGEIEVLGLVFMEAGSGRKIAYFNDCSEVGPHARKLAEGADCVILDGLRPKPHPTHMTTEQATQVALDIGCPLNYLTHLTYQVDHATWEKKLPPSVYLAYDGLRIRL